MRPELLDHLGMAFGRLLELLTLRPGLHLLLQRRDSLLGTGERVFHLLDSTIQILHGIRHAHGHAGGIGICANYEFRLVIAATFNVKQVGVGVCP